MNQGLERIIPLAEDVLSIAKAQLLVSMRFLDRALYELKPAAVPHLPLATDGSHLFYEPLELLHAYRRQQGHAVRVWAHMLMHCLYRHMFVGVVEDERTWNLACDLAAETVMMDLNIRQLQGLSGRADRQRVLEKLKKSVKVMTAEHIYHYLRDHPLREAERKQWEALFEVDSHAPWYNRTLMMQLQAAAGGRQEEKPHDDQDNEQQGESAGAAALNQMWKEISEKLQTELETFARQQGFEPGSMLQSLRALNRERCDYRQFLRKFAARTEVMRVSPDEFDYVFYTYGLSMYGDMPLIEPLEYREDKRIRDFVIAIDTSSSVAGQQVQKFLQKTFTILKQEETFDRRFNLHIIQCDAEIQEDAVVTTQEEFDQYMKSMTIRGLGGTDFRPVFEYVEKLRKERHFRDLRGLLYFTDGYGFFPARQTDYMTAFIFVDDEARDITVPPWAIRLVMETQDLEK